MEQLDLAVVVARGADQLDARRRRGELSADDAGAHLERADPTAVPVVVEPAANAQGSVQPDVGLGGAAGGLEAPPLVDEGLGRVRLKGLEDDLLCGAGEVPRRAEQLAFGEAPGVGGRRGGAVDELEEARERFEEVGISLECGNDTIESVHGASRGFGVLW